MGTESWRVRLALIATAVCVAIAGGLVVWKPWGGALVMNCGAAFGQSEVRPGETVAFWQPLHDSGRGDEPITLLSASLTHVSGNGRFAGVRLREGPQDALPVMVRWPDSSLGASGETTRPLPGHRVTRGEDLNLYFLVEQTEHVGTIWASPAVTYRQGWRIYTATSDCQLMTNGSPLADVVDLPLVDPEGG